MTKEQHSVNPLEEASKRIHLLVHQLNTAISTASKEHEIITRVDVLEFHHIGCKHPIIELTATTTKEL